MVTWHTSHDKKRVETLQRAVNKLAPQVKAYWYLEDMYVKNLPNYTPENMPELKGKMRDLVKSRGYARPEMTENDVDKILKNL